MLSEYNLPINFAGRDGFYWWIGQIEASDKEIKPSNRFKVRIVGQHLKECGKVATQDLPWASVMLPATTPYSTGNTSGATANFKSGDWVVGFFLDGAEGQQPMIMGSIGTTANASANIPAEDPNPGQTCKAFTNFVRNDRIEATDKPKGSEGNAETTINKNQGGTIAAGSSATAPNTLLALPCENSEQNPFGTEFCVELAKPSCPPDTASQFERTLGGLFKAIQDSNGQIGSALVSKYTGGLMNTVDLAQGYINKCFAICRTLLARVKGEIIKWIRKGIDELLKAILTPKNGGLKSVIEFMKKQLERIGCTIDGLLERILNFLSNLIFGLIMNILNNATCAIESAVSSFLNDLESMISGVVAQLLSGIQAILSVISSPLDIIGQAINYIMNLLGISCSGVGEGCNEEEENCTTDKPKKGNPLDAILEALSNGSLADLQNQCDEAYDNADDITTPTVPSVIGGTPSTPVPPPLPPAPVSPAAIPPTPTYDIVASVPVVDEGDTVTYFVTTDNVSNGTALPYQFNVPAAEISVPVMGTITITVAPGGTTGTGTLDVTIVDDAIYELDDTITIQLLDTGNNIVADETITVLASDAPAVVPVAAIPAVVSAIVDSTGILNLTNSGSAASPVNFVAGAIPPAAPVISVSLVGNLNMVITNPSTLITPSIFTPPVLITPSYRLTADRYTVDEGDSITFTFNTTNVADNTTFNYTLFGSDISSTDFVSGTTLGSFQVVSNTASIMIDIADDTSFEGLELCTFSVNGTGQSVVFGISADITSTPIVTPPTVPFVSPVPCSPIVDSSGQIISISVCTVGGPYLTPPFISISGAGFGASAVAELNDDGYLTGINILRPGIGYEPTEIDSQCIITGFILTRVGSSYTTNPTVYINGDSSIASATIDDKGRVIGVEIFDRTKVFNAYPKVEIFGDGYGAAAVAKISCISTEDYINLGIDLGGDRQGSYVDCP